MIRPARLNDLIAMRAVEKAADAMFDNIGIPTTADEQWSVPGGRVPFDGEDRTWVTTDENDSAIGYILVRVVAGNAHVEQVSVHPRHAHKRLGAQLMNTAAHWADEQGMAYLTLTTYAEVPWNGPYYKSLGFEIIPEAEIPDELRQIQTEEAGRGVAVWPRVVMRRSVRSRPQS